MRISGLQKLSMVDYPGKLAATVFTGGCGLRCPFCHNAPLVLRAAQTPELPQAPAACWTGWCSPAGSPCSSPVRRIFWRRCGTWASP